MPAAAVSPSRILKELDELWVNLSKDQQGDRPTAVLRACAMTLVVITDDTCDDPGETLAMLMRDHPSRLIVIRLNSHDGAHLDARVLAQCWMPFGRRQQICCEQIEITASRSSLTDVPSIIRGLTVPDLPIVLWNRTRAASDFAVLRPLLSMVEKLVVDSGGVSELREQALFLASVRREGHTVADLAWTRLTRWREAIAQVFDEPANLSRLKAIRMVRIDYEGAHIPMSAIYVASWLKEILEEFAGCDFIRVGGSDRARVHTIALLGPDFSFSVAVGQDRAVQLQTGVRDIQTVFPRLSEYELLREELSLLGPDPVYDSVLSGVKSFLPQL